MARNKYPEETVKLILDAATHLFVEKGYDATSLQDIINETNLSKGAIYHHFSSKEEIFEAISYRIGEENAAVPSREEMEVFFVDLLYKRSYNRMRRKATSVP